MVLFRSSKRQRSRSAQAELQKKTYAYHAHRIEEVLAVIGVTDHGLSETDVSLRRERFGDNQFTEEKQTTFLGRLLAQLKSPLAFVLVLAFVATWWLGEYIDAGVILFSLSIAIIVGMWQEGKASRAFKLLADSQVARATVWRDAKKHEIDAAELVVGDVVEIVNGSQVPADLRLLATKKLSINEAALTGEWLAVSKDVAPVPVGSVLADQTNMAWMGTFVAEGFGTGVVVATGDETAMGQVASQLASIDDEETPLQVEMRQLSLTMLYVIMGFVACIFVIGLLGGQTLHDMLLMAIAVAVASIPEGLPAAVTIILAVGMEALLKRGGLVRNLLAAETLGSTTYVLTDKTGTLTEGTMVLTGIVSGANNNFAPASWSRDASAKAALETAIPAIDAYVDVNEKDTTVYRGDPMEQAILAAGFETELLATDTTIDDLRTDYLAFTSENRFAAGVRTVADTFELCVNGAPEYLLERSIQVLDSAGETPLTEEIRGWYHAQIEEHSRQGRRLVGVARKTVAKSDIPDEEPALGEYVQKLTFVGLLVFDDPVRKGVKKAIAGVQDAGAEVLLITGDNAATALSIARSVGIAGESETALTGADVAELTDEELLDVLEHVHVYARVLPKQKLRIAQVLQASGEIVAMTGDGINDAPALRKANIGVAIGSGTAVAKESSDLVLVNDSFATIYAAIEEGRRIIANLRKIVGYLLSTGLSEVTLIATALIIGAPIPILPAQILIANIIEEGLMSVAFAFEPGEKKAMRQSPQDIHEEGILSASMLWFILFVIFVLSSLLILLYFILQYLALPIEELRSVMFLAIAVDSLFIAFAFRSLTTPMWRIPLRTNLFFVGSFLLSATLLVITLSVPWLQQVVSFQPLPWLDTLLIIAYGILGLLIVEFGKWLFFERFLRRD